MVQCVSLPNGKVWRRHAVLSRDSRTVVTVTVSVQYKYQLSEAASVATNALNDIIHEANRAYDKTSHTRIIVSIVSPCMHAWNGNSKPARIIQKLNIIVPVVHVNASP